MTLTIATWNVNSINARLPNVTEWLKTHMPDVLLLQELKATEDNFPRMDFAALGYNAAAFGQKSWNGVWNIRLVGNPRMSAFL